VTAATLVIQPLNVDQYPVKFVTLFSVNDEPFQYQLDTVISQQTVHSQNTLDGIIWLRTPPVNTSFSLQVCRPQTVAQQPHPGVDILFKTD